MGPTSTGGECKEKEGWGEKEKERKKRR